MKRRFDLIITVKEIKGDCPVYKVGDKIIISQGFKLDLKKTNIQKKIICFHSLSSFLPYLTALSGKISPKDLGLSKDKTVAYVQCLDPGEPYTTGGTVIFEIRFKN